MGSAPRVVVIGPSSWNHIVVLDALPEPHPHMQAAVDAWWTVGGTSAGKALHLLDFGVDVTLVTPLASDADGDRVRTALAATGLDVEAVAADRTESHTNLMTAAGQRVSLYTRTPSEPGAEAVATALECARGADAVVADLSALGAATLDGLAELGVPVWTDLHDWDGREAFHSAFARAARAIVLSDDGAGDHAAVDASLLAAGAELVIRTRGAAGASVRMADGRTASASARRADIVDTNGAGDAFCAGALVASLAGAEPSDVLEAGAAQAVHALESRHLSRLLG
ncbi:carbohydrate kinase family protein [Demequina sp. NBRC 110056]|uniref:carbohydrate kinase family protein n=1 Tax=Demequina sp. NBRC 110056 TaxID=1570345 RepID=UPI000A01FB30|nr:carbohydrate kinase family protein [Demequina sp. NBRC 110056]